MRPLPKAPKASRFTGRISKKRIPAKQYVRSGHRGRSSFVASRLQDSDIDDEDEDDDEQLRNFTEANEDKISSGEDSAGEFEVPFKPYSSLLQTLNARSTISSPRHNKRNLGRLPRDIVDLNEELEPGFERNESLGPFHDSEIGNSLTSGPGDEPDEWAEEDNDSEEDTTSRSFDSHFNTRTDQDIGVLKSSASTKASTRLGANWKVTSVYPKPIENPALLQHIVSNPLSSDLGIKHRLQSKADQLLSSLEGIDVFLARLFFNYTDVLFCSDGSERLHVFRNLASLHALNHVLKTRVRVLKNNQRAAKDVRDDDIHLRDQGFTRPKVLFILPTRHACHQVATSIASLYQPEQQENRKRFQDAFGGPGNPISESKPQDFHDLFAGNDDDMYRVGLKFTRKTVKFFAQFYNSDMIFASPLGLRMAIGDDSSKKKDYDFLSSIELVIMDQTEALIMQNWEHVEYVFNHLNLLPREAHGCDYSRVRSWYLDDNAKFVRQTLVMAAFNTPEINNLFNLKMLNLAGKVKIAPAIYPGFISAPDAMFRQTFYRFDVAEPTFDPDARFKYFTTKIVPQLAKHARESPNIPQGVLIFIPSYMDFVRLRNYFANSTTTRDIPFASLSEYTPSQEGARARSHFMGGRHGVLLYSGRIHHFRRYLIRGTKRVVFYGLPDNPNFYKELASDSPARGVAAGKLDAAEAHVQVLFTKWDVLRLERVVGTRRSQTILSEKSGDIFEFIP